MLKFLGNFWRNFMLDRKIARQARDARDREIIESAYRHAAAFAAEHADAISATTVQSIQAQVAQAQAQDLENRRRAAQIDAELEAEYQRDKAIFERRLSSAFRPPYVPGRSILEQPDLRPGSVIWVADPSRCLVHTEPPRRPYDLDETG